MAKMGPMGGSVQRQGGSGKGNGRKQTYMSGMGKGGGTNSHGGGKIAKSGEMRTDMSSVTERNPYPKGLA